MDRHRFTEHAMPQRHTLLFVPLLLVLGGCRPSTPPANSATNTPGAKLQTRGGAGAAPSGTFKAALLTNGSLTDSGWNSLAGKALDQIKSEMGAQTSHQSAGPAEAEEALRGFARDGYRLIFAHGNEFGDAAKRVAGEYGDSSFVVSSGEVQAPNVASLKFDLGEASYLAGMLAAGLSKSGKAGQIGGESFPPVKQAFDLFEKGGKAVAPEFTSNITYLGNWSDASAAKEKALGMVRSGADVLFQNCDAAGEGVFQAAEESKDKGVAVIGSNADQNDLKPDVIAASAVIDIPRTFMTVAKDVQAGVFKGGVYREDLKSGNVYLAINPNFESKIPPVVRAKMKQAEDAIKSGKLKLVEK